MPAVGFGVMNVPAKRRAPALPRPISGKLFGPTAIPAPLRDGQSIPDSL